MKKNLKRSLIFVLVSIIPLSICAQIKIDGALGLKFGLDKKEVEAIMTSKGYSKEDTPIAVSAYSGVTMGALKTNAVACYYTNNKLKNIAVLFFPSNNDGAVATYRTIKQILLDKYGNATENEKNPNVMVEFIRGEDSLILADVKNNNIPCNSYWHDPLSDNTILLQIIYRSDRNRFYVQLDYNNAELYEDAKRSANKASDF
jgi:hypothetical protein